MYRIKILFFLLLINQFYDLIGQDNVEKYHMLINNAELKIVENKFEKSAIFYEKAFRIHNGFAIDLSNAFLAAYKCGNEELMKYAASKLIEKGTGINYFNQSRFANLKTSDFWIEFLNSEYKISEKKYLQSINFQYRSSLENLMKYDQEPRRPGLNLNLEVVNQIVHDSLLYFLETYGFPSEEKVGIWFSNDTFIKSISPFEFLVLHQFQSERGADFIQILKSAVQKGELKPIKLGFYAGILDDESINFGCLDNNQIVLYQINDLLYECSCKKMKVVNKRRKSFYLEPLEITLKKIKYYCEVSSEFRLNISYSHIYKEANDKVTNSTLEFLKKSNFKFKKKLKSSRSYFKGKY